MQEAIQLEQQAIDNRVLAAESIRKNIELVLLLSSILTGLVSVGLGLFMVRRLSQRIVLLLENTVRLSERSPLHKPLPGNDELAFVDHSLYEAAEKLTKLEQFKQEMIAVTSHELRTPLNSLLVLTELVEIGAFGPLKDLGAKIQKEAHAQISELITMITDLLDLEKMQSGKMLVVKEASEIDSTLSAVATNLKPLGDKKGVEIRTNSSGLTADADPYRLTQALTAVLREIIEEVPEQSVISLNSQSNYKGVALKITAPCIRSSAENAPVKAKHPARERLAVDLSRVIAKQHGGDILIKSSKDERIVTLTFPQNAAASV
jgi:signal transduction histidine kinase